VITALDPEEGLKKINKDKPDLIILDVMLPKMDGYAFCQSLKENTATSHIPILILTSLGNQAQGKIGAEIIAQGHKAEGYLEKPVESEVLVKTVNQLILKKEKEYTGKNKVLIIDDDQDLIEALKAILENANYEVLVSYTGEDGINIASNENPDIILLDVMLPKKDGYTICKELKSHESTKTIPIILLTSIHEKLTDPGYAKAIAVTHQADDFIEKPVTAQELIKRIHQLIGPMRRLV
jgi:two-component system alkaline phosphatase synthesis response regulator PhoP